MALIVSLAQSIIKASSDDQRLRAINNFLNLYNKMRGKQSTDQPIPFCYSQDQANSLVNEGQISPNSLFINNGEGEQLGIARLTAKLKEVVPKKR
jgi:hypothetical protein